MSFYKEKKYSSKKTDAHGIAHYTKEENTIWRELINRQMQVVQNRACEEYIKGLEILNMSMDRIPQCAEVNAALSKATGWNVQPVEAIIPFDEFFSLLAHRKFPAACFIRTREDFDYIKEPDIFHELYGHCPMLTEPVYADFMQKYGEIALNANHADRVLLARLYWFTVEFGLINTTEGTRIYGGGILSSKNETIYAADSTTPQRKTFDPLDALRTPYRIDILQPIYFVLDDYHQLYDLVNGDLIGLVQQARKLGEYPPSYAGK